MQSLANLRQQLGLSQEALAHLLGVSRSTISLVELGRRVLPHDAWLRYSQLQQQLPKKEPAATRRRQNPYVRIPKHPAHYLDRLQSYLHLKSLQLKIQADMMERKRDKAKAAVAHLGKAFKQPSKRQKLVLDIRTIEAETQLNRHPEALIAAYRKLSKLLAKVVEGGGWGQG